MHNHAIARTGKQPTIVLAGDFNLIPNSHLYSYFATGELKLPSAHKNQVRSRQDCIENSSGVGSTMHSKTESTMNRNIIAMLLNPSMKERCSLSTVPRETTQKSSILWTKLKFTTTNRQVPSSIEISFQIQRSLSATHSVASLSVLMLTLTRHYRVETVNPLFVQPCIIHGNTLRLARMSSHTNTASPTFRIRSWHWSTIYGSLRRFLNQGGSCSFLYTQTWRHPFDIFRMTRFQVIIFH